MNNPQNNLFNYALQLLSNEPVEYVDLEWNNHLNQLFIRDYQNGTYRLDINVWDNITSDFVTIKEINNLNFGSLLQELSRYKNYEFTYLQAEFTNGQSPLIIGK